MQRLAIFLCSIACFVAASLPLATPDPVVVRIEKPAPRMWVNCTKLEIIERERACRARSKSL